MSEDNREPPFVERRQHRRREDDVAEHEIVERAVETAPLVNRLLHTGKVATAVAVISAIVGGVGGAMGIRMLGPADDIKSVRLELARVDTAVNRRIDTTRTDVRQVRQSLDSVIAIMGDMRTEMRLSNYTQCALVRKFAPELRPPGCDAAERRGGMQR